MVVVVVIIQYLQTRGLWRYGPGEVGRYPRTTSRRAPAYRPQPLDDTRRHGPCMIEINQASANDTSLRVCSQDNLTARAPPIDPPPLASPAHPHASRTHNRELDGRSRSSAGMQWLSTTSHTDIRR